jgi:cobalt transporter subunit CbtB
MAMAHFESEVMTVGRSATRVIVRTGMVSARIVSAIVAIALGIATIAVVGFAPSDFIHGAAHDARHAAGFPCH